MSAGQVAQVRLTWALGDPEQLRGGCCCRASSVCPGHVLTMSMPSASVCKLKGFTGGAVPQQKAAVKRHGKHYTPPALADFLAERVLHQLAASGQETLRILDPA